jgi:hypothetical protein
VEPGSEFTRGAVFWQQLFAAAHSLGWRRGLADGLGAELRADCLQGADARRELVLVALDDVGKLPDQGNNFVVGQFKVHGRDMGPRLPGVNPSVAPVSSNNPQLSKSSRHPLTWLALL